jgi:hypothetical protein
MKHILTILATILITACSTTANIKTAYQFPSNTHFQVQFMPERAMRTRDAAALEQFIKDKLAEAGLLASTPSGHLLGVNVIYYRMRSDAERFWAGIFAGTDLIKSDVQVKAPGGEVLSEFEVETSNTSAWGVTEGYLADHAEKIVEVLKRAAP